MNNRLIIKKIKTVTLWLVLPILVYILLAIIPPLVFGIRRVENFDPALLMLYTAFINISFFVVLYFSAKYIYRDNITKKDLGIDGLPTWTDIGLGIIGFIGTMVIGGVLLYWINKFFPAIDPEQAQNIGFGRLVNSWQFIFAFISLVIITPIMEELIFRGLIYSQLRKDAGVTTSVIIVSFLFGLAHGQWNVAIITFVMSVLSCLICEKLTHSIWAGIILHMIKNGIAFFFLFIVPIMFLVR